MFTSADGKPVSREKATSELIKILHKLQADHISIPEFTFHALRHTFATRGLEQGGSLRIMQAILGHTTLAMTPIYIPMSCLQQKPGRWKKWRLCFHKVLIITSSNAILYQSVDKQMPYTASLFLQVTV